MYLGMCSLSLQPPGGSREELQRQRSAVAKGAEDCHVPMACS